MSQYDLDHSALRSGANFLEHNKFIRQHVGQHRDYIVYLDNVLVTRWNMTPGYAATIKLQHVRRIEEKISILEAKSNFMRLSGKDPEPPNPKLEEVRRLLALAMTRVVEGGEVKLADELLKQAEATIKAENDQLSRR